jgi:mannose-1-phosphate guanylyltransferase
MLQHTWDRADQISHPNCKITVVGKPYLHETCSQLGGRAPGTILTEPKNFGMIPSLYLALTYLQTKDPDATVIAYPSDHFIYPEAQFLGTIQRAVWASERLTDHVILVGVFPPCSNSESGYIRPDRQLGWVSTSPIYGVREVRETPFSPDDSRTQKESDFSNTSVIVSKADVLWRLGWENLPTIVALFEEFKEAIGTSYEKAALKRLYQLVKVHPASLNALFQGPDALAVMELKGVTWSEWETPDQIIDNLATLGKQPIISLKSSPIKFKDVS